MEPEPSILLDRILDEVAAALFVLAAVALAAHLLPARQAAATRPAGVLRAER